MTGGKPILPALILLITIGSPSIIFTVLQVQRLVVKHEMAERLEAQNLQTIKLPSDKVRWYEENKEIIIDGKLFDVKSFTQQPDDMFLFTGLFDEEETDIKNEVEKLLQKNDNTSGKNSVARFFFLSFIRELTNNLLDHPLIPVHGVWRAIDNDHIPDIYLPVISPPPKI